MTEAPRYLVERRHGAAGQDTTIRITHYRRHGDVVVVDLTEDEAADLRDQLSRVTGGHR